MWLNVGRTYITHSKGRGSLASLKQEWRANASLEHNESGIWAPHGEVMPAYASRLGYDTVQSQFTTMGTLAEAVVMRPQCMTHVGPLGACVPLDLRTGWDADRQCVCDSDSTGVTALQCVGAGDGETARSVR